MEHDSNGKVLLMVAFTVLTAASAALFTSITMRDGFETARPYIWGIIVSGGCFVFTAGSLITAISEMAAANTKLEDGLKGLLLGHGSTANELEDLHGVELLEHVAQTMSKGAQPFREEMADAWAALSGELEQWGIQPDEETEFDIVALATKLIAHVKEQENATRQDVRDLLLPVDEPADDRTASELVDRASTLLSTELAALIEQQPDAPHGANLKGTGLYELIAMLKDLRPKAASAA